MKEDDEMGEACGTIGKDKAYRLLVKNPKRRDHLEV
jgi:hypothetical protein